MCIVVTGCGKKSITAPNAQPVARAGTDQTVTVNELVILDGKESEDPDGDPLIYRWTQDPNNPTQVILAYNVEWGDDPDRIPRRMFVPTQPGEYIFELTVHDGRNESAPTRVRVTVTGQATAPPGMVRIPAGEFVMGSDELETERPPRTVFLKAYFIDIYEVTNAQYREFLDTHPNIGPPVRWADTGFNKPNQPVIGVLWDDAAAYCQWVGKRLPTEAEWEKAARGTDGRRWPWGNVFDAKIGGTTFHANVVGSEDGFDLTAPVGSYPTGVSPYGVFDMAGNVDEWVQDLMDPNYYAVSPRENPVRSDPTGLSELLKVVRGGYFSAAPERCRTAYRRGMLPVISAVGIIGFRCAKDAQ
jgi:formylglycine-generating enzyme required for sulfatase activity